MFSEFVFSVVERVLNSLASFWETLKEVFRQLFGDGGAHKDMEDWMNNPDDKDAEDDELEDWERELQDDELEDWERDPPDDEPADDDRSNRTSGQDRGPEFDTHWD